MNILSKGLLYQPQTPSQQYRIWYYRAGTLTELGVTSDLAKTFNEGSFAIFNGDLYNVTGKLTNIGGITSSDGRIPPSNGTGDSFFISNNKLYSLDNTYTTTQIGSDSDWLRVCGITNKSTASVPTRGFVEKSDGLYYLEDTTPVKISNLTNWDSISSYGRTNDATYYGYGINQGKLYYLYVNGNGAVQQGTDTTWTCVSGGHYGTSGWGCGINNGKLYSLDGTPTRIGSYSDWDVVSGNTDNSTSSSSYRAIGIRGGKLYLIKSTSTVQVGSSSDWVACSGGQYGTITQCSLAYNGSAVYYVSLSNNTPQLTKIKDGKFIKIYGSYYPSSTNNNINNMLIEEI